MGMRINKFFADPEKVNKGVWVNVGAGFRVRLAKIGNTAYRSYIRDRGAHLQPALKAGITPDAEELRSLTIEAMARHIILDWENLEDEEGNPIRYSPEEAAKLLRESDEFYDIVWALANDHNTFRRDPVASSEEAVGNSSECSSGSSSGDLI